MTGMPPKRDPLNGQKTLKVTGFLEEFEIDDIKKRVDIIELFESFGVKLTKSGKNYIGLCPFHDDKNPSLSVDREKGLFNCFSGKCGVSGSVVDAVMSFKNTDFKGAKNYLKDWRGLSSYSPITADLPLEVKPLTVTASDNGGKPPENPAAVQDSLDGERIKDLNTVKNFYHKRLYDHPEAIEYLKKRGLTNAEHYERFQVGFADGSLNLVIGEKQRQTLTEAGILNDKGFEHFKNCLIFPILDDNGQTISFYGRDIDDNSSFKHRYLKGSHKGVWNRKASKVYDEIILTESIIDALSLIETGLENVQAIYGTNGFTDEHLETLKADRVKTVVLALDSDEAGQNASQALKERLINEGFKVKILSTYGGKDWNEALTSGVLKKEDLTELINQLAIFDPSAGSGTGPEPDEIQPFTVKDDGQVTIFQFKDISMLYRVAGVKDTGAINMRVNIRAELEGEKYFDNLDLYSARSRFSYAQSLSRVFGLEMKRVEKDLVLIVDYFDEARLREKEKKAQKETVELSEADRRIGLEFLKAPDLFNQIVKDMETLGYVGEDLNKQLMYLCATSRILDDPISIMLLSESSSGKSMMVDTVELLIPPEDVIAVTSLSDQALNYIKNMLHKFLTLGEAVHSDVIEHQIREMLSGKELSRLVTIKDEKTGKMESQIVRTPAVVASAMSSTVKDVNPENASRCFLINADESREQTRRIHEAQREKYSLERHYEKEIIIPEIIKKHHAAQRLLRKVFIVNPFGKELNFPDNLIRTRRDNSRFLDLIACVCFLRQYQKELKSKNGFEYIECGIEDYRIAYEIMINGVLSASLLEIPKGAAILYEEIRRMVREMAGRNGIKPEEVSFIQRDIREYSKFNNDSIKKYLKNLVELEYIQIVSGKSRGTRLSYRLRKDEELEKIDLTIIPTPENMSKRLKGVSQSGENVENDGKAL